LPSATLHNMSSTQSREMVLLGARMQYTAGRQAGMLQS